VIDLQAPPGSRRAWTAAIAALTMVVVALLAWLVVTPLITLRAELRVLQFWWLEATVFVGLAVAAAVLSDVARVLERRDLMAMIAIALVAVGLTLTLPYRTNRIFYDEQIYQNVGRNLADSKRAQLCNDGTIRDGRLRCVRAEYNKQPYAYPHLLSLVYRTFGVRANAPFAVNAVAMGLTVLFVYLLVLLLFADRAAAFGAAALLALIPEQLIWSASGAAEPTASLAFVAALLAAACFVRTRSDAALAGVAIATAYASQFRPESLLVVPIVGLLLWQRSRDELLTPRMCWAAALFLGLTALQFAHVLAVRHEGWGTTQERMGLSYAIQNLRVNGWFFLRDPRFPPALTLLAVLGIAAPRHGTGRVAIAAWFLALFGITLFFYAGSYDYGADVRYSVMTNPPIAIFAGLGVAWVVRTAGGRPWRVGACVGFALVAAFLYLQTAVPVVRATTDSASAARADVEFAKAFAPTLPTGAYVLTHTPAMFQVWGVDAGQMSLATDPGFLEALAARATGGVYLHWNYWCNTQDPIHQALCARVRDLGPVEPAGESRSDGQRLAFYRMTLADSYRAKP
jgi:dolichyl-phosphate-mannose-protein mannosyltransferase